MIRICVFIFNFLIKIFKYGVIFRKEFKYLGIVCWQNKYLLSHSLPTCFILLPDLMWYNIILLNGSVKFYKHNFFIHDCFININVISFIHINFYLNSYLFTQFYTHIYFTIMQMSWKCHTEYLYRWLMLTIVQLVFSTI